MILGYVDRVAATAANHNVYCLPRNRGESRVAYVRRFFREVRGLGNVLIVTRRGRKCATRAVRYL